MITDPQPELPEKETCQAESRSRFCKAGPENAQTSQMYADVRDEDVETDFTMRDRKVHAGPRRYFEDSDFSKSHCQLDRGRDIGQGDARAGLVSTEADMSIYKVFLSVKIRPPLI